jgi:adiponectin receptor
MVYVVGALIVFSASTIFHLFLCLGKQVHDTLQKIDFISIALVMYSMFWPFTLYLFDAKVAGIYLAVASCVTIAVITIAMLPVFNTNRFHVLRPLTFGLLAVAAIAPITHATIVYASNTGVRFMLYLTCIQFGAHVLGAIVYATKLPERITHKSYPNNELTSHFIFHVLISVGLIAFYYGQKSLVGMNVSHHR